MIQITDWPGHRVNFYSMLLHNMQTVVTRSRTAATTGRAVE